MRVSLVIQDLYRLGAQYVTALVAKGLAQRGHQVEVVVSAVHDRIGRERPDLHPFPLPDAVRLVRLPHLKASENVFSLARHLHRHQVDVLIIMSSNYFATSVLAAHLQIPRPRLVYVEHASGIGIIGNSSQIEKNPLALFCLKKLFRWCWQRVDRVVTVSNGVASALHATRKIAADKMVTIYNPVIDDAFFFKKSQPPTHPWLTEKKCPVIVAAGAHVPFKAQHILIEAVYRVNQSRRCKLILFGEGELTQALKDLATERGVASQISFPGHTANLPAELKAADVFVVSSHCESFSIVLVEALACGVPVVSTNCPSGPPEILQMGRFGLLVSPNDPDALAEGILKVLNGKGIHPPIESWEPYRLDQVIDQYEALLKECRGNLE